MEVPQKLKDIKFYILFLILVSSFFKAWFYKPIANFSQRLTKRLSAIETNQSAIEQAKKNFDEALKEINESLADKDLNIAKLRKRVRWLESKFKSIDEILKENGKPKMKKKRKFIIF